MLTLLLACAPPDDTKPAADEPVPYFSAAHHAFGTWDGQVYLTRMSAMPEEEPGEWAPFAIGEVYDAPVSYPLGGGLPDLPEGCWDAETLPFTAPTRVDVGPTLPLAVGARTFGLELEPGWNDYWWMFGTELACDCDVGTAVALPDADGEVLVPAPVTLDDGFADAWAAFRASGALDLRWAPGSASARVIIDFYDEDTGVTVGCTLDDDGAARLALPLTDGEPSFLVNRVASRAVDHPTYGTVQLTVRDTLFPTLELP